ncbi:MAG: hypothetical protein LUP94_01110, partial [Candidatus Methanomethylicus sp.]|nr:hypothetical protein [Candidatus Methanomethylicus sp.]
MEKQETQHQKNHITNSFLLKIKGQEIACIVCKKDVVISFAEDEVLPGYGPFNLIAPIYVFYSGDDGDEVKPRISIDKKYLGEEPLQILRNFRVFVSHEASHIYMTEITKWRRWHRNDPVKAIIA